MYDAFKMAAIFVADLVVSFVYGLVIVVALTAALGGLYHAVGTFPVSSFAEPGAGRVAGVTISDQD